MSLLDDIIMTINKFNVYDTNHIIQLAKDAITRKEFSWQPSQNISQREAIRERKRKTKGKEPL